MGRSRVGNFDGLPHRPHLTPFSVYMHCMSGKYGFANLSTTHLGLLLIVRTACARALQEKGTGLLLRLLPPPLPPPLSLIKAITSSATASCTFLHEHLCSSEALPQVIRGIKGYDSLGYSLLKPTWWQL